MATKIILAGATGLIGRKLMFLLVDKDVELHTIGRRKIEDVSSLIIQHVAPVQEWGDVVASVKADVGISCLGTTIRTAGSQAAFRAVDFELARDFAAAVKSGGAERFIAISSTMANNKASNFYLKTKGEAEDAMQKLNFSRLDLIRPGLLKGHRQEFRLGEYIAILLSPFTDLLLHGSFRRYRSIQSATVARAVACLTEAEGEGHHIHENDAIAMWADKFRG